jgi:hypothetical protein
VRLDAALFVMPDRTDAEIGLLNTEGGLGFGELRNLSVVSCSMFCPKASCAPRHFGYLANRAKKQALPQCRKLLGLNPALPQIPDQSTEDLLLELTGVDLSRCPACKQGTMIIVAELPKPRPWNSS